jgi:VWFA-related protein
MVATRGAPSRSATISFGDVLTLIRASDVTIHTVGFLEHQSSSVKPMQRARLSQIAEATGGQSFFPSAMKDVEAAYDKVAAQVRAQYSLGYVSTNTKQDGEWRKVEIRVRRPDLRDARVQSRKGYFAPYRESQ